MNIDEHLAILSKQQQHRLAFQLIEMALPLWSSYANEQTPCHIDTIEANKRCTDPQLLYNCLLAAMAATQPKHHSNDNYQQLALLETQLSDFDSTLRDQNEQLPESVRQLFCATTNLIAAALGNAITVNGEPILHVVIKQAIAALHDSDMLGVTTLEELIGE